MKKDASRNAPEEIDDYLANIPEDARLVLEELRAIIKRTVPDVTGRVSYQIPIFRLKKDLVGIGCQKNHLSFYTMSPPLVKKMREELKALKISGATVHLKFNQPLPEALIIKILKARVEEMEV